MRGIYDVIAANVVDAAPLAYAFVHQLPGGAGTWDMSKLTYLQPRGAEG